jgi:hypothetical protein
MPVEGHDIYFHIRVLMGVVLGLALTRMLAGVASFAQHPKHKPLYAGHLVWIAVVVLMAIEYWWSEFDLVRIQPWHFELFVFVLGYAFMFYLMATMLIPTEIDEYDDYTDYFISRRWWFFALLALAAPVDWVDSRVKGIAYLKSLGPIYPFWLLVGIVVSAIGAWSRDRRVHTMLAIVYLIALTCWILYAYRVLE